jgi:secondary thiamine-phosphate synthase enzyme
VVGDTLDTLDRLVPWEGEYQHKSDNAASHVKSCLVGNSQTLLVEDGNLVLGEFQGLFLAEFSGPRARRRPLSTTRWM